MKIKTIALFISFFIINTATSYAQSKDFVFSPTEGKTNEETSTSPAPPNPECISGPTNQVSATLCSASCGGGTQNITYTNGCATWVTSQSCNTQTCCTAAYITATDSCSASCGGGVQTLHWTDNCSTWTTTQACNTQACITSASIPDNAVVVAGVSSCVPVAKNTSTSTDFWDLRANPSTTSILNFTYRNNITQATGGLGWTPAVIPLLEGWNESSAWKSCLVYTWSTPTYSDRIQFDASYIGYTSYYLPYEIGIMYSNGTTKIIKSSTISGMKVATLISTSSNKAMGIVTDPSITTFSGGWISAAWVDVSGGTNKATLGIQRFRIGNSSYGFPGY